MFASEAQIQTHDRQHPEIRDSIRVDLTAAWEVQRLGSDPNAANVSGDAITKFLFR